MAKQTLFLFLFMSILSSSHAQGSRNWRMVMSKTGKVVDLRGRHLKQVPSESLDVEVEVLLLDDNDIREFPLFLPTLCPRLKVLSMNNNCLSSLPDRLGHSTGLQELYLDGNEIEDLPSSITGLSFLRILSLENNRLRDLTTILENLPQLENLYVNNNLIRQIPDPIGNLSRLSTLSAPDNLLTSVSVEIAKCKRLRFLYLSHNPQLRRIPDELVHCTELRTLDLYRTNVSDKLEWRLQLPELDTYRSGYKGVKTTKSP